MMIAASRQTKLKLRKGFVAAPINYRVLMVTQFTDEDRNIISKGLIVATNPIRAAVLLPKADEHLKPQRERSKWSMRALSLVRDFDVQILMYKGVEVALFLKRQTSVVTPEPEDPAPEGVLEDDEDIWARLDLFSKSPRQLVGSVRDELAARNDEIAKLTSYVETLKKALADEARTITSLRTQLANAQTNRSAKTGRKK